MAYVVTPLSRCQCSDTLVPDCFFPMFHASWNNNPATINSLNSQRQAFSNCFLQQLECWILKQRLLFRIYHVAWRTTNAIIFAYCVAAMKIESIHLDKTPLRKYIWLSTSTPSVKSIKWYWIILHALHIESPAHRTRCLRCVPHASNKSCRSSRCPSCSCVFEL